MKKIINTIFAFFIIFNIAEAKMEVDKAFIKRTGTVQNKKFLAYSPDIYDGKEIRNKQVLNKFGCNGKNISPKIIWKNAPVNTKSFAITMYTKDVNSGSGWWHWIVYNIPNTVNAIQSNASQNKSLLPKGAIQGINDYGEKNYGGVCVPNNNKYNYIITIYALDVDKINLPKNSTPAMVALNLNNHKIATTQIKSFYVGKGESTLFKPNKSTTSYFIKSNNSSKKVNLLDLSSFSLSKLRNKNLSSSKIDDSTKNNNDYNSVTSKEKQKKVQKSKFSPSVEKGKDNDEEGKSKENEETSQIKKKKKKRKKKNVEKEEK